MGAQTYLNQSSYYIDCANAIEEALTPISSQVFIFKGMSLCSKQFLIRSHSSGYLLPPMLEKVDDKNQEDLEAYGIFVEKSRTRSLPLKDFRN